MLAAHALGALEQAEARLLEEHLATCAECQAELEEWRGTAAALAHSAKTAAPSPTLRARILEAAQAQQAQQPSSAKRGSRQSAEASDTDKPSSASNVTPISEARRSRWRVVLKYGALAAGIAFAALIITLLIIWNRYTALQAEQARLSDRLNQMQEELAREREARELLATPDVRIMRLVGTDVALRARARLAYDTYSGRAMLFAYDLPPAPAGKAYQLWTIADGKPLPGGVFTTDPSGRAVLRDQIPAAGRNAALFAVTLEPASGVDAPTGDKYLLSSSS